MDLVVSYPRRKLYIKSRYLVVEPQDISPVLEKTKTQIHAIASGTFLKDIKFSIFTPGT